jgi:holo-[acyl-carrier protein] synthase
MPIIGHGIDLVEIARIGRMLAEHGEPFIERCFTPEERGYCESGPKRRDERYAARLACKEAVFKALGTGWTDGIGWRDVEIVRQPSGRPMLRLHGRCAEVAAGMGIRRWHVSLSHTDSHAIASVVGEGG